MPRLLWLAFFYQGSTDRRDCAFMDTRRSSVDDDDDDVPPPAPAREAPAREASAEPSYADMLRSDEWPSLGS